MLRIHRAMQSGNYPNATALAGELEVSTKSIYRDIDFMFEAGLKTFGTSAR